MPTVYIGINFSSVIGSIRRNPYLDDPIQLETQDDRFINTENVFELAVTTANFNLADRSGSLIQDRAGSTIVLRG